jgi:2-keto-4-pentenoate hydratase
MDSAPHTIKKAEHRIEAAAEALRSARVSRNPIPRISETFGIEGMQAAYEVAYINTRLATAAGRQLSGRKAGLTSQAVQQQLGVDRPDYGVLFSDMEFMSGAEIDTSGLIQPKVEGEVAFVVGRDLKDEKMTWGRFLRGIEYALPAIEIVDSAIIDWKITLVDTVADNASCGVYVLGHEPRRLGDVDLARCGMDLTNHGRTVSVGSGAACLGNPLVAAHWLAQTMNDLGEPLRAGDVILAGALGPMVPLVRGDRICVEIGGLGSVRCAAI